MRKIIFRGIPLDGKKMIYGFYGEDEIGNPYIEPQDSNSPVRVKKKTIGQYSGLHDPDGRAVYEGDIIGVYTKDVNRETVMIAYPVEFDLGKGMFSVGIGRLCNINHKLYGNLCDYLEKYKVMGNVHENPDLLNL